MSTFARFVSFAKGLFWDDARAPEEDPEALFEAALQKLKGQHQRVQAAVGRLVYERNCLRAAVERKEKQLDGSPEVEAELAGLKKELAASEGVVADSLGKLRRLEAQRKQLESRRTAVLAKLEGA